METLAQILEIISMYDISSYFPPESISDAWLIEINLLWKQSPVHPVGKNHIQKIVPTSEYFFQMPAYSLDYQNPMVRMKFKSTTSNTTTLT